MPNKIKPTQSNMGIGLFNIRFGAKTENKPQVETKTKPKKPSKNK